MTNYTWLFVHSKSKEDTLRKHVQSACIIE